MHKTPQSCYFNNSQELKKGAPYENQFSYFNFNFLRLVGLGGCGKKSETPSIVGSYTYVLTESGRTMTQVIQITQTNENYFLTQCIVLDKALFNDSTPCLSDFTKMKDLALTKVSETEYSITMNGKTDTITATANFSSIIIPTDSSTTNTYARLSDDQANNIVLSNFPFS